MDERRQHAPAYVSRLCVPLEIAGVVVTVAVGVVAWQSNLAARVLPRGGLGVVVGLVLLGLFAVVALKVPSAVALRRTRRVVRRHQGRVCTRCLHPLGGGDRCSECGLDIDADTAAAAWRRVWPY